MTGTVPAVDVRPILVFVLTVVLAAPVIAIAGVVAWGVWAPIGLGIAGWLVVLTGRRALPAVRRSAPSLGGIRLRMLTVVWMVIVLAALITATSAFWLVSRLIG